MDASSSPGCSLVDDDFGPWAGDCRGGFDFTLLFEESILSILPSALLIIVSAIRLRYLLAKPIVVVHSKALVCKLVCYSTLAALHVTILVLWTRPEYTTTPTSVASAAVAFITTIALFFLSYSEHNRSTHPSSTISFYLLATILFDAARVRTLILQQYNRGPATLLLVIVCLKFVALVLETREKQRLLRPEVSPCPPEATAGVFNKWFFWWENSLLRHGYGNILGVSDLFQLDSALLSEELQAKLQTAWSKVNSIGGSLLATTMRTFLWPILAVVPYRAAMIALTFCQPLLINRAIRLSEEPMTTLSVNTGYGLIGAYVLVYTGLAVTAGQYQHLTYRTITMARGALVSMLYNKATTLKITSVDPASSLTLMSADIERITTGWQTMHELWASIAEMVLAIFLLQQQLGAACAVPVGVALISLFGSAAATGLVVARQKAWLEAIERRIAATATMLGAMKGVKMCGLTDVLSKRLQELRVDEMNISKGFRKLLIWNMAFSYVTPVAAPILTFAVFSVIAKNSGGERTLDTARVFTSLSLFTLLSEPLTSFIMSLTTFMGSVGSFTRIQEFLQATEHRDLREQSDEGSDTKSLQIREKSISQTSNVSMEKLFHPEHLDLGLSLKDEHYYFTVPEAIAMKNLTIAWDEGEEAKPTLHGISIDFLREKFIMVVGPVGCGKSTLIKAALGEVSWSEGSIVVSSTSISYCEQTPWHMNCTIQESIVGATSRFDERWYNQVLEACALNEDLKQLPRGDQTRIGSKGVALSGGQSQRIALARAVYAQKDIVILDDVLSSLDEDTENRIFHNLFGRYGLFRRRRSTVILASSSVKRVPYAEHIVVLSENGTVAEQGTFNALNASGGYIAGFALQPGDHETFSPHQSYMDRAAARLTRRSRVPKNAPASDDLPLEDSRRTGDLSVYAYYMQAIGWLPTLVFVFGISGFIFCQSFPNVWVKWWATANAREPNENLGYWLSIYAVLGILALLCLVASCWQMIIAIVPKSGIAFHSKLLHTVLNAPMSFFSTTDVGVTLNRFSQDLQLIDMELPITALNTFAVLVMCIAQVILIGIASPYAAISFPICLGALWIIQKYYLRTSRQLRFLELETKSPLYSEFVECLSGLATIRAFGWQKALHVRNREFLDASQRPFYLLFAIQRWLTLILDLIVGAVAVILIVLVVQLRGTISAGYVGIALLNVIVFSQNIKVLVMFWTMLETHIGAIARIKVFSKTTENENLTIEAAEPPLNWPSKGSVEFSDVSASYKPPHNVVSNVNLSILPSQKIAICGRTGSGKSSLILTLFRMLSQTSGMVSIDGIDLSTISRQTIRSRLIGVPQDSYLFPGTVLENADPFSESAEAEVIEALEDVQLWDTISDKGGLAAGISDVNLTHGQRQLFCLARAMLRPGKIVVLDEATSSIDSRTEALIQSVLRTKFASHTVIVVAHKLESILDFDMVALMDNGRIVEYEPPHVLLSKPSRFKELYESSGGDNRLEGGDIAGDSSEYIGSGKARA